MSKKRLIIAFATSILFLIGIAGYYGTPEEPVPASEPTSTPVFVAEIPASFFGLHYFYLDNPWPSVPSSSFRMWDMNCWAAINTAEGKYNWTDLDYFLDLAREHNIDVLYTFGHTPRWASQDRRSRVATLTGGDAPLRRAI